MSAMPVPTPWPSIEDVQIHPVAEMFPEITGDDFAEFARDIKEHGLREPICLMREKDGSWWCIDGRNRLRVCKAHKIAPKWREWSGVGSLTEYVVSLNMARRHLDASQRAYAAAMACDFLEAEAAEREKAGTLASIEARGRSSEKAAKIMGVSRASVNRAKKVRDKGSKKLKEAVQAGKVKVSAAAQAIDKAKTTKQQMAKIREQRDKARAINNAADAKDCAERWGKWLEKTQRQVSHSSIDWHLFPQALQAAIDALREAYRRLM